MLKFNNDHLFTGFVKQLLASFNLPSYRIYTKEHQAYFDKYGKESPEILNTVEDDTTLYSSHAWRFPYIKEGKIQEYRYALTGETETNSEGVETEIGTSSWKEVGNWFPEKRTANTTKRLKIKNNIYDSYTHEYLGNYLRCLRDYYELDLMSLYNCFSDKVCQTLVIDIAKGGGDRLVARNAITFNAADKHFKIYMLPVKLFKEYTIAIDCDTPVEFCCGLYGKYQDNDSELELDLPIATYKKYGHMRFGQPVLYSPLKQIYSSLTADQVAQLAAREEDLKLYVKLPAHNESSIAILEGNYRGWNDRFAKIGGTTGKLMTVENHVVTNFEGDSSGELVTMEEYSERGFKPITFLSLLAYNTGVSYPFSDKLMEYLSGNAITHLDPISDDILRAQTIVAEATGQKIIGYDGLWDERMRPVLYDFMQNRIAKSGATQEMNQEILGYVDKTLESRFGAFSWNKTKKEYERTSPTIAGVDIYPDIYLATKEE